jgi:tetratricopeptide (TPR) repeat protein
VPKSRIELHARQSSDLASLRALHGALERRGQAVELTAAPTFAAAEAHGIAAGPNPCLLRITLAGPLSAGERDSQHCGVIVDAIDPVWRMVPPELRTADMVFVPGPSALDPLRAACSGQIIACGLARLDDLVCDPRGSRVRAREQLCLPTEAEVVLYAPSADPHRLAESLLDAVARLPACGLTVLVLPCDGSEDGMRGLRELASRMPGLALPEDLTAEDALAACDVVVSDRASLLYEAAALGRGVVHADLGERGKGTENLDPKLEVGPRVNAAEELPFAVRAALPASPSSREYAAAGAHCRTELLVTDGSAAERMADAICEHLANREGSPEGAASDRPLLERIEAQLAFGDTAAAREKLLGDLERQPSPTGYRLLASIHRKDGDTASALRTIAQAEQLARRLTAEALCERGRILVESAQAEAGREAFEEARRLDPELVDALVGLGSLAVHGSDAATAEECFRSALAREKSARTLTGLGLTLLLAGRAREAQQSLEQALDLQADYISAVYGIVQAGFQTGDLVRAERRVHEFVKLHSGNLDLVFTLAGLRYQLGDRAGALEMLERIELFDPHYDGLEELKRKLVG